jgi:protein-S-isoprenylcysteine O-methyltransferase Ste14
MESDKTSETIDSAGVKFPPPFVYAGAVIGGYLLNRWAPLPIGTNAWWEVGAMILVALWGALTLSSFALFWRGRNSVVPNRPASKLVVSGPYRFTRNPMYVGLGLLTTAIAIVLNTWWPVVLLVPALAIIRATVIAREESYLRRRFGAEYDAYTRRVRRWI